MSEQIKQYGIKILDTYKKKIGEFFEDLKGEKNILYLEKLIDVKVHPEQELEYTIGIPLEKGRKVDFAMTSVDYSMSLGATLRFKDFPLNEVIIRFEFPSVLFGVKGSYPKIIFTTTLNTAWPGDFGLVWMPLTGSEKFAFHPYENRDKKSEDLINFYTENIVDPLCDYLNSSDHILAAKIRENIKKFIESENIEFWNYKNPFGKKKDYNFIEVPIYCDYFDENDTSILYFETFALKNKWVTPADVIVEILQYIGLSTEMFDYDGNLITDPEKLKEIESKVNELESHLKKLEKKKRAVKLKEEWDPFKAKKTVKRDILGYEIKGSEPKIKSEYKGVLEQVQKMKELMQPTTTPTTSSIPTSTQPPMAPTPPITETPTKISETPKPPTAPESTEIKQAPPKEFQWEDDSASLIEQTKKAIKSSATQSVTSESQPQYWQQFKQQPAHTTPTQAPSAPQTGVRLRGQKRTPQAAPATSQAPAQKVYTNAKEWFAEFQMRQFITIGDGMDLNFRQRGDFKIIANMPKPFMLTFARDTLRTKKMLTSAEVIEILFNFYKSGHIRPV